MDFVCRKTLFSIDFGVIVDIFSDVIRFSLFAYVTKIDDICDMAKLNTHKETYNVSDAIRSEILSAGEGKLYILKDFAHYYNDDAVRRAMSRFVKEGFLERITQGIYLYPIKTKYGIVKPTPIEIAEVIARRDQVEVLPSGPTVLNTLGLSEQVPMKAVFDTTGSTRNIVIQGKQYSFKHKSPKYFVFENHQMSYVVAAMKAMGPNNISRENLNKIMQVLETIEDKDSYIRDLNLAPNWIRNLIVHGHKSDKYALD